MDIRRIKAYPVPSYPDKPAVQRNPYMLHSMPARWRRNTAAATAAMTTVLLLTSACDARQPSEITSSTLLATEQPTPTLMPTPRPTPNPTPAPAVPLFEHGYGRGGFGCVSVNPPAYLSEDEALDTIRQTAENEGLQFTDTAEIRVRLPALHYESGNWVTDNAAMADGMLRLDGFDREKQIAFTYVSQRDVLAWDIDTTTGYSFTEYPIIDAARTLAENLADSGTHMTVAVFYDPVEGSGPISKKDKRQRTAGVGEHTDTEAGKESLRQQVLDFIAWLKAQGIV